MKQHTYILAFFILITNLIACTVASAQPYVELEFNAASDYESIPEPGFRFTMVNVKVLLNAGEPGQVFQDRAIFPIEEITVELNAANTLENPIYRPSEAPDLILTKEVFTSSGGIPPELQMIRDPFTGHWDLSVYLVNVSPNGLFGTNEFGELSFSLTSLDGPAFTDALPNLPSDPNAYYLVRNDERPYSIEINWTGSTYRSGDARWGFTPFNPGVLIESGRHLDYEARIGEDPDNNEPCPGDLNEDGNLNFLDVSKFLDLYGMGCE
jgi:hypothetical protein